MPSSQLASTGVAEVEKGSGRRLHILAVAKFPLGGIRTYFKYTYGHLDPEKYRFTFVVMQRRGESDLIARDLSRFPVDLRQTDEAAGNRGIWRAIREALRQSPIDLIHSHGLTSGIITVLANWRARLPHVITHHDVFRSDQFAGLTGQFKAPAMASILSRAEVVICVTEDARWNFTEFLPGFPADKLAVVPNGIDTLPFAAVAERRRARTADRSPGNSLFTFGFLGRFMPQKGFDVLVDAVSELTRHHGGSRPFRILAVNTGDCIGRYRAQIARLGLGGFFEFAGFRNSVAGLLNEVDAVVMPSRWEAGPLAPMEVLVAGCPLIASDCIGLREVIRGTPALVVRAEDPPSLAQQMKTAMDREDELGSVFADYASVACDRFDVRRTAAAMERIFPRLIPVGGLQ